MSNCAQTSFSSNSKFSGLKERSEELTRPSPVFPVPVLWRSHWVGLRHAFVRSQSMLTKIPFADPSPDRDDQFGLPKPTEPLAVPRKAAFQWIVPGRS